MSLHMQMQMGVLISEHICYEFSIDITKFFHLFSEETIRKYFMLIEQNHQYV